MWNYRFNFENCCWWKFVRGASTIIKTITGLFPLSWQDGIGGDLVDYSLTGKTVAVNPHREIPYNLYHEVEYIDSSGTQYIDTGLTCENCEIYFDAQLIDDNSDVSIFGSYKGSVQGYFLTYYAESWFFGRGTNVQDNFLGVNKNTRQKTKYNTQSNKIVQNDTIIDTTIEDTLLQETHTLALFGRYSNGNIGTLSATRLWSWKVTSKATGDIIQELVPVLNVDTNKYGLYDIVTKQFYGNIGTGDFIGGNEVTEYIGVGDYGGKRNQLVNPSLFSASKTESGITFTNNGDGSITISGTAESSVNYELHRIDTLANHKYAVIGAKGGAYIQFNEWYSEDSIYTETSNDYWTAKIQVAQGTTVNTTIKPNIIDLTALFPTDTPTTVLEAKQRIAEVMGGQQEYYPYDAGTDYYCIPVKVRNYDESYEQEHNIYRTSQLVAGQTIRKTTDGLPNFTSLPTGYLQMGVDTQVAPSGGSVTYKSRSVSL